MSCLTNLTIDNIHNTSITCTDSLGDSIYKPVTALLYLTTAIVCFAVVIITQLKYNSIEVFNLIVRTKSISNLTWIVFFLFVTLRCIVYTALYCIVPVQTTDTNVLQGTFIAGWTLKSFETMLLCVSLNYQRKYRSGALIDVEVNRFNKRRREVVTCEQRLKKILLSHETFFVVHFLITVLMLVLTEVLQSKWIEDFFFTFVSVMWCQSMVAIFLVILIVSKPGNDGPTQVTKVLVVLAVFFSLPSVIPDFLWTCITFCSTCETFNFFTCYDITVFCSLFSLVLLFLVLRAEFIRLNQESRWAVVGEVQAMFNVDT